MTEQALDLIVRNGRVINPAENVDAMLDVGVQEGRIAAIGPGIEASPETRTLDASGCLVLPGLIDFHTHIFYGGPWGVDPDALGPRTCVITMVDCGTAGAGNFHGFLRHVIQRSSIRIYAFLHIAFTGLDHAIWFPENLIIGELEDPRRAMVGPAVEVGHRYPEIIRGIKVRASADASGNNGVQAISLAQQVAKTLGLPLMVHVALPPPTLKEILALLRPGDILTHAFRGAPNSLLGKNGSVLQEAWEAKERGIFFDIGHGCGGFAFKTGQKLIDEYGFLPDTISSDVHTYSINGPAYDLLTTMSKFLALGMPLTDVVKATTATPAKILGLEETMGNLSPGRTADISVVKMVENPTAFEDGFGKTLSANRFLVPDTTIKEGKILWSAES